MHEEHEAVDCKHWDYLPEAGIDTPWWFAKSEADLEPADLEPHLVQAKAA